MNELNMKSIDSVSKHQFSNYVLKNDNLDAIDEMSCMGVLIHKNIQYKRHRDLESMGISSVWIQISYPGRKSILIQAVYHQFQRLGVKGSIAPKSQHKRWKKLLKSGSKHQRNKKK